MAETYKIELGALIEVPCWETHRRGKNWAAVISRDPKSPGGLARQFLAKARGEFYYMVEGVAAGDVLEFGADYYTGGGNPNRTRVFMYVLEVRDDILVVQQCATSAKAFRLQAETATQAPGPAAAVDASEQTIQH